MSDSTRSSGPDPKTATLAVRTDDLWKIYPQEPEPVQAVRGVTLEIESGDFVAMAGPSGSGKTTLLNLLGGLTDATRGRIWIGDEELTTMDGGRRARLRLDRIGFVFQAYNLLPVLTALENAEFTLLLRGMPAAERRAKVAALFSEMGLDGLADRRPAKLSGGQQQRVAVARAVVGDPALVLADEPTANLDPESTEQVEQLLLDYRTETNAAVLWVTHDTAQAQRVGSRRFVLEDGLLAPEPQP